MRHVTAPWGKTTNTRSYLIGINVKSLRLAKSINNFKTNSMLPFFG